MPDLLDAVSFDALGKWAANHGKNVVMILVLMAVANRILRRVVPPALTRAVLREATPQTEIDLRKRATTLANVLIHTAQVGLLLVGGVILLDEFGFNVAPFLTGLGIGGIALGLGAQSLVRDVINGVFMLIENQYGEGDLVTIGGTQGWVEAVNLRRTILRDADGTLYTVPNGEVKVAGNLTRGFSGINLLVPVLHTSDVDRAMTLINEAGQELAADPQLGRLLVEAPRAARVEALTEKGVMVRVLGKALPGAQFELAGALRRRIKRAFDAADIRFGEPPPAPPPAAAAGPRPPA